ncbi:MAG TPA: glycosyltransferase [Candidatus Limnocylindria bacterium]|nr:glycosyltransferase [Candidatus Limnocylindria bacterium]
MRWLVAGVPRSGSTGGAVRARHIFAALAERTDARLLASYGRRGTPAFARAVLSASSGWRRPVRIASTQLLPTASRALLRGQVTAAVLDLHDHPGLQAEGLGIALGPGRRQELDRLFQHNADRFALLVAPSSSFVELCGLDLDRVVVITNGTDTARIAPRPSPPTPIVALVSGAAPGRGIEHLLAVMTRVRDEIPEAGLRLALTATGPASADYLRQLTAAVRSEQPWVGIEQVPFERLDAFLGGASVLAIPHPPGSYLDAATPVKLFDSMAAGRPLAVTPRTETRRIVEAAQAGIVAASDSVEDLAEAIWTLLRDEPRRRTLGENARRAAVERYDWRVLSAALADAMLGPQNASR